MNDDTNKVGRIRLPRAGISGYSCNRVMAEFSSVVGEEEGDAISTTSSWISSVEFIV